ncbi:MAG: 5-formyltetrahydrofolate cyclo-ligase [Ignavibacteriota bacterium]
MSDDSAALLRSQLRKEALSRRDKLDPQIRDAYSQLIRKKAVEYITRIDARHIHCYLNFRSEVITLGIIADLIDRGIKISVPIISEGSSTMDHAELSDPNDIRDGYFGTPEPSIIKLASVSEIDAVLIPIVAFDGMGMRLGYGKGFYDKFLAGFSQNIRRIGIAFSCQELDNIPKLPHDQLMNNVFTEQSAFFFE